MVTIQPQTQFGEDRCTQFRVIVVTAPPHTHKHTTPARQTWPNTIHCAAKLSAQCKNQNLRYRRCCN